MEAFALLKFWKSNNAKVAAGTTAFDGGDMAETTAADSIISDPLSDGSEEEEDDDDSFFELELTMPNYDSSSNKFPNPNLCPSNNKLNQEREKSEYEPNPKPSSKPQSPISILRSAPPKLRVFMFGKLNRKPKLDEFSRFETESVSSSTNNNIINNNDNNNNNNLFTVKFKIEDGSIVPKFTRTNSSNHLLSPKPHHQQLKCQSSDEYYESPQQSKRFSKDVVQKYLNRIKPLYAKSSKRSGETESFAPASPTRSTASFPSPRKEKEEKQSSRFKAKCKQLGKSKSASAMIGAPSPASFPARNDHPVDGIEGAILHCKRSLNSSRGHSSLSRCSSDPSPEKSIQVSEIQRKKTDISACL